MRHLLPAFCVLLFSLTVANAASISSVADLAANSDLDPDGFYTLKPGGDYVVDADVAIRGTPRDSVAFAGTGDTLTLANTGTSPLLLVNLFALSNGATVIASGADAGGAGLQANGLTIAGPDATTLTATGGNGANARGVRIDRDGLNQSGGTVNATGGGASTAEGLSIAAGGYLMGGGVLNASGGSASSAAGVRVSGGGFTMNDGTATIRGGTAANAAGIWVSGGDFLMAGGDMTVSGGTAGSGSSYGIRADNGFFQTGGSMTVTGGATSASSGIYAAGGATLSGGSMTVAGGSASGATGIETNGRTVTVTGSASLDVTAGSAANAHGIFTNVYVQSGGTVETRGGSYSGTYGMTGNSFTMNDGSLTAIASDTADSRGVSFYNSVQNGGAIIARGGAYDAGFSISAGFFSTNLTQNAGSIDALGGSGQGARGMSINNTLTQYGDIAATGGSGTDSYGLGTFSGWTMHAGAVTARGGTGDRAYGAYSPTFVMNSGSVEATGGSGANAAGMRSSSFTVNGGEVSGTGGSAAGASGVDANTLTLAAGSLAGDAGSASGAHGVDLSQLIQGAGAVTATGGGTDGAHGIWTGYYDGNGGSLTAIGGAADNSYGLYVSSTMNVSGTVRLERPDKAGASVYVNGSGLTFRAGSVLQPVVDIGDLDGETGSGLILTAAGATVTIDPGALLNPYFLDRNSLVKGVVSTDYLFIDTVGGVIDGEFTDAGGGGLAIQYVARKINNDSQYVLTYERILDTDDVIAMIPCVNSRRLLEILDATAGPDDDQAELLLQAVDMSADMEDLRRIAARIGRTMTPTAYTKLTGTQLRTVELMQGDIFRQLHAMSARARRVDGGSEYGWANLILDCDRWRVWADGLYQQSSRFAARCSEFDSPKEKLSGISAGAGRDFGTVAVAGAFSYVKGDYRSGYSDIGVDNYGASLGVKVHNLVPAGGWLSPWAALVAGYAYGDIDQKALNYSGTAWKTSSPTAHMYRASLELGNDFHRGDLTWSPIIGVDYAHIRQNGYREIDPAGYGLRVSGNGYDSLRPRIGVALNYRAAERLDLGVNAHYRYETMDGKSSFTYSRLAAPGVIIPVQGEKRTRSSGTIGATARYRMSERCLLQASYDLLLEDGYSASRFTLGMGVSF